MSPLPLREWRIFSPSHLRTSSSSAGRGKSFVCSGLTIVDCAACSGKWSPHKEEGNPTVAAQHLHTAGRSHSAGQQHCSVPMNLLLHWMSHVISLPAQLLDVSHPALDLRYKA